MASKLSIRRNTILEILSKVPISSTQQLAEQTGVSNETIRKDLDCLAEEGLIIKMHGGVALASSNATEIPFDLRTSKNTEAKSLIAQKAVTLIQSEDVIVLESCTTNLELAKALVEIPEILETLIVVTNSFPIASVFDSGKKCKKLFFLGGWVNPKQYSCRGWQTTELLEQFNVSKAFLSGAAMSDNYVLAGYYDEDVNFQKAALKAAQETILMMDHSKFGKSAIFSIAPLSEFHYLVTDKELTSGDIQYLSENHVNYIQV